MNNRGQFMPPFFKWLFGLILIFMIIIIYEFFQPLIGSTLPTMFQGTSPNSTVSGIVNTFGSQWELGMMIMAFGIVFYTFFAGLPGNVEDQPF